MKISRSALAAAVLAAVPVSAQAACGIDGSGRVDVITNFFNVYEVLRDEMEACGTDSLEINVKANTEYRQEMERAFAGDSSPWDGAGVANSSITLLQAKGQLMPLDDLVEKYRDEYEIEDRMLIRFGDKVMALAFMVNAQHLFYRTDIFAEHGIEVPTTYEELLAAAETIGGVEPDIFPFAAAFGNSWELGNEYVNLLLANGGQMFDPATSEPTFQSPEAVEALKMMGRLYEHMSPNALSMDFGDVKRQLQQGEAAMAILWGNEASDMDDADQSTVVGDMGFAPAPAMEAGGVPASTFWWDGYVIPRNLDGDADLAFQVIAHALRPETVAQNNGVTLWLRSNYEPTRFTGAIIETVEKGVPPYPMNPQTALAHSALGENIADFIVGKETAEASLADAAADYLAAARDQGLIAE